MVIMTDLEVEEALGEVVEDVSCCCVLFVEELAGYVAPSAYGDLSLPLQDGLKMQEMQEMLEVAPLRSLGK